MINFISNLFKIFRLFLDFFNNQVFIIFRKYCDLPTVRSRRTWRKLHLGIDENHQIIACDLTDKSTGDTTALDSLFDQIEKFNTFVGDGAYDGDPVYKKILAKSPNANIYVPPPKNAVENSSEF